MDVFTAISERRSVRAYQGTEVDEEKINQIIEAGRLAPSAANRQEWKFIVVRNHETRQKLASAANNQGFLGEAPVVIVCCAMESKVIMPCGQLAYTVDLSIATAYMILAAYELDLGTCWIGAFKEEEVKKVLDIPNHIRVVSLFPVGYPAQNPAGRPRKSREQILCFEKYV
ncbi:MAG: nitroreductase family protein [Desulfotomaculaceae bacterium]|nr:nitroreductase family protein [Desulfotomaculaceae bacterium]